MPEELDMVAKQANLTAQIETEHLAAKRWWDDYGLCFIENSKLEDFTYENRIKKLKEKLKDPRLSNVKLKTSNHSYGNYDMNQFKTCAEKSHGICRDNTIG